MPKIPALGSIFAVIYTRIGMKSAVPMAAGSRAAADPQHGAGKAPMTGKAGVVRIGAMVAPPKAAGVKSRRKTGAKRDAAAGRVQASATGAGENSRTPQLLFRRRIFPA